MKNSNCYFIFGSIFLLYLMANIHIHASEHLKQLPISEMDSAHPIYDSSRLICYKTSWTRKIEFFGNEKPMRKGSIIFPSNSVNENECFEENQDPAKMEWTVLEKPSNQCPKFRLCCFATTLEKKHYEFGLKTTGKDVCICSCLDRCPVAGDGKTEKEDAFYCGET